MKKVYISKYRSESATSDLPKQHDMEQDYRLAVLSAAIRAGEASGEAIEFDPFTAAERATIEVVMSVDY